MESEIAKTVEGWFRDHIGDGEFVFEDRPSVYSIIEPSRSPGKLVFTTKPAPIAAAIHGLGVRSCIGMIARYGLPSDRDIRLIHRVAEKHEFLFLGDMDPTDLMIFASLRVRLHPKQVLYLGVNDSYLDCLGVFLPESFITSFAPSESKSLPMLKRILPDLHEIVGDGCHKLLDRGKKIELEAVVSAALDACSDSFARGRNGSRQWTTQAQGAAEQAGRQGQLNSTRVFSGTSNDYRALQVVPRPGG